MQKPKLIFLNGFAASGKTTLKERYIADHKFTLGIEGDVIIALFGQWKEDWNGASVLRDLHVKNIVRTHLGIGHDVFLPFLPYQTSQIEEYQRLAEEVEADFFELYLKLEKEEAVARLLRRGTWGEEGLPPLTEADRPKLEDMFDVMESAINPRENTIFITPHAGKIEETYQELLTAIGE